MTVNINNKKRSVDDFDNQEPISDYNGISLANMANYLMLLSQGAHLQQQQQYTSPFVCFDSSSPATTTTTTSYSDHHIHHQPRVFECKTCNRQFPSFQALGGHRASHKRPKLQNDGKTNSSDSTTTTTTTTPTPPKPKSHECSICGLEFPIGQALGGHMRRHRAVYTDSGSNAAANFLLPPPPPARLSLSLKLATAGYNTPVSSPHQLSLKHKPASIASEMLRRTSSGRATLCLDLNLTPFENGVDQLGKLAPIYG